MKFKINIFIFSLFVVGCSDQGATQQEKDFVLNHFHKYACGKAWKCTNFTVEYQPLEFEESDEINGITKRGIFSVKYLIRSLSESEWDSSLRTFHIIIKNGVLEVRTSGMRHRISKYNL